MAVLEMPIITSHVPSSRTKKGGQGKSGAPASWIPSFLRSFHRNALLSTTSPGYGSFLGRLEHEVFIPDRKVQVNHDVLFGLNIRGRWT